MNTIEFIPAPAHIIIIGPNATLGKLFKTVKYGSITFAKKLFHHIKVAIKIPMKVPNKKLIVVSQTVTNIWLYKFPLMCRLIRHFTTLYGEEKINEFIIL